MLDLGISDEGASTRFPSISTEVPSSRFTRFSCFSISLSLFMVHLHSDFRHSARTFSQSEMRSLRSLSTVHQHPMNVSPGLPHIFSATPTFTRFLRAHLEREAERAESSAYLDLPKFPPEQKQPQHRRETGGQRGVSKQANTQQHLQKSHGVFVERSYGGGG